MSFSSWLLAELTVFMAWPRGGKRRRVNKPTGQGCRRESHPIAHTMEPIRSIRILGGAYGTRWMGIAILGGRPAIPLGMDRDEAGGWGGGNAIPPSMGESIHGRTMPQVGGGRNWKGGRALGSEGMGVPSVG